MVKRLPVSQIMTVPVIVANTQTKFSDIIDFLDLYKIQHLPVAENDRLIGIISVNDVMKYISGKLKEGKALNMASLNAIFDVREVMTVNPVSVEPNADFAQVVEILAEGKFQSVPVVKNGDIVGIVTNKDVVKVYEQSS